MYSYGEATIDCAIVDGELRHIDEFEDLKPDKRPVALCQDCNNPLIYSYGDFKVHHFRHQPGDECSGGGEGKEHYQAKLHIASALKETNIVSAFNRCSWCRGIGGDKVTIEYDDVQLEYVYDNGKKADVGLLKNGKFCGSIEVFVSHRCEFPKISFHRNSRIPCIEIHAQNASGWIVGKKLQADTIYGVEQFICVMCKLKQLEHTAGINNEPEPVKQSEPEPPKERIKARLIGRKTVWCKATLRQNREFVFEVIEFVQGFNQVRRLQVREEFLDVEVLCEVTAPFTETQRELFRQKYKNFIEKLKIFNYQIYSGKWRYE